jgi:hypothetical protein
MILGLTVECGHRFTGELNRPKSFVYAGQNQVLTIFILTKSGHFVPRPALGRENWA